MARAISRDDEIARGTAALVTFIAGGDWRPPSGVAGSIPAELEKAQDVGVVVGERLGR